MRWPAWIRSLPPATIVAIGWVMGLVYAFPGLMTIDSLDQLREARAHVYTDSHPPAMSAMWRVVDAMVPGRSGMLVLQTGAFVIGLYLILRRVFACRTRAAIASALLFVFPPVLAPMAVIWKDCVMAGGFLLGTALLLEDARRWKLAGLASLFVATAVRYNAPAATLSIVVLLFAWPGLAGWRRYLLATGAWLAVTAAAFGWNAYLTDTKMYVWQSSLAVLDIAGTLAGVDEPLSDEELRRTLAGTGMTVDRDLQAALRARYALCKHGGMDFMPLIEQPGGLWYVPLGGSTPAPEPQREAISRAFWDVVTAHPGAYLAHRWRTTREVLALTSHGVASPVMTFRMQYAPYLDNAGLDSGYWPAQDWLQQRVAWVAKKTPLFRPWIYVVVAMFLLPFAVRSRQTDAIALLLSALAFEATLVPLAATPDYRYSHWLVICTLISIVMVTARRAASARAVSSTRSADSA